MTEDSQTDEEVARLVQAGNKNAYALLVERYEQRLLRYGRSLLFDHTELEDIVQEIFIKAYKNLNSFDSERKFSPWIYRIAHNEFVNHGQKRSRSFVDYFDLEVLIPFYPSQDNVEKDFDRIQLSADVEEALKKVDEKYREPLMLYFLEQLSYQEIADILHVPINTVGIRIMRGKEKLKKLLVHHSSFPFPGVGRVREGSKR